MTTGPDLDLDSLSYLAPIERRWFRLEGVHHYHPHPVEIEVVHLGTGNDPFLNAIRKSADKPEERDDSVRQISRFSARSWRHVVTAKGETVSFDADRVEKLLRVIADKAPRILNELIDYVVDARNFRGTPTISAEVLGKE